MNQLKLYRSIGLFCFLLMLWPAVPVNAQQDIQGVENLDELIREALNKNPEVLSAKQRWEAAQQEIPQARSLEDPQVSITQWAIPSNFNIGNADETWVGIGQSFPFPGKRSLKSKIASKEADAAEQEYLAKIREVVTSVKSAYYQLFLIQKTIGLHLEHQALLEEFIQIAEQKYALGQVAQQDGLKARVDLSKLHNSLLMVEQEKTSAQAEINMLLNRSPQTPLENPQEPTYRPFSLTLEDLQKQALQDQPQLRAAGLMMEKNSMAKNLANKNYLPDFMVEVMYWDVHSGPNKWEAIGKMNLPWIFKGKYDARVRQAALEEARARADYQAVGNQTLFRLQDLFVKVKTTEQLVEVYRDGVLPQAEQSLEAARIGYQAGRVDFLNLIESERTLRDLQLEYYTTLTQFNQYIAQLEQVVGTELQF